MMLRSGCVLFVIAVHAFGVFGSNQNVNIPCVSLEQCSNLQSLINHRPTAVATRKLLKASRCNTDDNSPKYWCVRKVNNCRTPNGSKGTCTPINQCPAFVLPTAYTQNYIEDTQCSSGNSQDLSVVCCPTIKYSPKHNAPILPRPRAGECGRHSFQLHNRIFGGEATRIDEFPWTALLQYDHVGQISTSCGASIISNRYVVTAAHCVDASAMRSVGQITHVILGEYNTTSKEDCVISSKGSGVYECADPVVRVPVEEIILHPQWYTKPKAQIDHDIALIRLVTPVKFTKYIKPVCLPPPELVIQENDELVVTGWGKTENEPSSDIKLKTTILMANRERCVAKYRSDKKLAVEKGAICVGGAKGKDSCVGDSGGPLMFPVQIDDYEAWFLAGIVSFGPSQPCGVEDYPGLYTFLPRYVDWIQKTVKT